MKRFFVDPARIELDGYYRDRWCVFDIRRGHGKEGGLPNTDKAIAICSDVELADHITRILNEEEENQNVSVR